MAEERSPYQSTTEALDSPVKAADEEKEEGGLKASISLFGGIMVIVGCIIGSGIFISPKGVHANAGSLGFSMVIWVFCGVFSAIGAYCYAELGTFIRQSGGDYAYVLVAFGELMGFLRLWIECIIVRPCTMTVMAMTFALYILRAIFPHCDPPPKAAQLLACGCLLVLTLVNCLSLKLVTGIQNVFTLAKLIALALIIFTGIVLLFIGGEYLENFEYPWSGTSTDPGRISMAFYSGLWAYNGWNYLNFVTEELENPVRNLPIAIAVSCTLCTIVYALTNIGFYAGVDLDQYLDSSAVAITFANRFYGKMAWIMPIFVAMSCFGAVNGVLLSSSRLFFVAGRQSHMPYLLSMINPYRETPIPAVFFTGFLACLYLTLSDNVYTLINYVQIVNWLAIGIATAGLLWLRRKMPPSKYERPLQVNIVFPIIFLLGCLFLVIFPIVDQPIDTAIGLAIMFSGVPAYYLFVWWQNKPAGFNRAMDKFTLFSQKLMLVAPIKKKD